MFVHIHGSRCKRVKKDEIDKKKGAIVIPAEEGDNMEQLFGVSVWRLWRGQVAFERCEGKGLGGREVGEGGGADTNRPFLLQTPEDLVRSGCPLSMLGFAR